MNQIIRRLWCLGLVLSLSGCIIFSPSVPIEQDGAPPGPPPRWFKAVIPKAEPLSRYGNPSTYTVRGKTYHVMKSARGYHVRGLASWYGTKFHRKRTSSGEPYNMYELTAAHKTLPLPTYLRVKNLDNGRETIVKVNDRGPFHSDRILDLSYGAAVKLGLFPGGVAHVELTAIVVNKPPPRPYKKTWR
jgi:rare lipoprotein A